MALGQGFETATIPLPQSGGFSPYLRVIVSSGTLALAGATDREVGTVAMPVPATGVGSGTTAPVLTPNSEGAPIMVAAGVINQFANVYGAASGQVSATPNGNFIGISLGTPGGGATANAGEYLIVLRNKGGQEYLYSNTAASASLNNTSTETDFGLDFSVPANLLKAGDILKIKFAGIVTGVTSTPTLNIKVYLGTTALVATGTVSVLANGLFVGECQVVVRTAGSGGTMIAEGWTVEGVPGTAVPTPFLLASTTLNTTIANAVYVSGAWSAASSSNAARLDVLTVERLAS